GEPYARGDVGDEDERGRRALQALDAADAAETGAAEAGQVADPLPQRELERGDRGELAAEAQELDRLVTHGNRPFPPPAQAVRERNGRWCASGGRSRVH